MTTRTKDDKSSIREAVRSAYAARVEAGSCCGAERKASTVPDPGQRHDEAALRMGYSPEELSAVPEGSNLGLGCGAPLTAARVRPGETVVDLGSGAGFDAFLAARQAGPSGRVIGVDMTPEMIERARANAREAGVDNVEFRRGLIEEMPIEDASVDVLISNCVINLSPDKPAVFREAFRVLKPGGRLAVSDIVLTAPLPEAVVQDMAAYVGCLAGASLLDDYLASLQEAGFEEVTVVEAREAVESLAEDDPIVRAVLADARACCCGGAAAEIRDVASRVLSAKITARKPRE